MIIIFGLKICFGGSYRRAILQFPNIGFDQTLRTVTSLQNIVAIGANVLLAYLIIYRSNGHIKSNIKEIILITCLHAAMFSAVMLVLQPVCFCLVDTKSIFLSFQVVLVGDGHIIAFSNGPFRAMSKYVSYASAVALFTALDVSVVCITVQFTTRSRAICKATGYVHNTAHIK